MGNRLKNSKSPYLRLHSNNPVDWYEWGEEAFQRAREEDKPIFLSIGYYTCHWCHVMNRESFMDPDVANELNKTFVCIKVDREERPDIDAIYMKYAMSLTGSGGWPLTVLLTPDKKPFFVATYLPRETLIELARKVRDLWGNDKERVLKYADDVVNTLLNTSLFSVGNEYKELNEDIVYELFKKLSVSFDEFNGGFGNPPKFPNPHKILFLLRFWKYYRDPLAFEMVVKTLDAMRFGGIYDQVGGGFHRYSTDAIWKLPHFEKMLYDQAWLLKAYTELYQITGDYVYRDTSLEIIKFLFRELSDGKLFYSALDAESEGVEGRYYIWSFDEISDALGDLTDFAVNVFNLKEDGNYFEEVSGRKTGYNILYPRFRWEKIAESMNMDFDEFMSTLYDVLERLRKAREGRVKPNVDDKILTDWNSMAIASISYSARIFGDDKLLNKALDSMDELLKRMYRDGVIYHSYIDGETTVPGFLDDYANMLYALNETYMVSYDPKYLEYAIEISELMIKYFYVEGMDIFLHTPKDSNDLIHHNLDLYDGPYPSGLSIAIHEFIRLSRLTGEERYELLARDILKGVIPNIEHSIDASPYMVVNVLYFLKGGSEVVVVPGEDLNYAINYIRSLGKVYTPYSIYHLKASKEVERVSNYVGYYNPVDNKSTVYICKDFKCLEPITDLEKAIEVLAGE